MKKLNFILSVPSVQSVVKVFRSRQAEFISEGINMDTQFSQISSQPSFITNEKLLSDLASVAAKLGRRRISQTDYSDHGRYSFITICRRFRSWREALALVNCEPLHWRNVPAEKLLVDLRRVAGGASHLTVKQYLAEGMYSRKIVERHFALWQTAVAAAGLKPGCVRKLQAPSRGPRTITVSLRYRVLLRDKFRCVACGRSPATDENVTLEVDHIHPWSRGGATRMENLQTLCSTCNKGKRDQID
jgi:hypothetical protein